MLVERQPPVHLALASRDFAKECAMRGHEGLVVLTCSGGEVDCMTYGGKTYAHMDGAWFEVVNDG